MELNYDFYRSSRLIRTCALELFGVSPFDFYGAESKRYDLAELFYEGAVAFSAKTSEAYRLTEELMLSLPALREELTFDAKSIYASDPAADSVHGGDTVVGEGSVIGANVWLTYSVPPGTVVHYERKYEK